VPLDVERREEITLLEGDACLDDAGVDDDPFGHGSTS
jgi:hypothetical protein